jgi:hypothetical protein
MTNAAPKAAPVDHVVFTLATQRDGVATTNRTI